MKIPVSTLQKMALGASGLAVIVGATCAAATPTKPRVSQAEATPTATPAVTPTAAPVPFPHHDPCMRCGRG